MSKKYDHGFQVFILPSKHRYIYIRNVHDANSPIKDSSSEISNSHVAIAAPIPANIAINIGVASNSGVPKRPA